MFFLSASDSTGCGNAWLGELADSTDRAPSCATSGKAKKNEAASNVVFISLGETVVDLRGTKQISHWYLCDLERRTRGSQCLRGGGDVLEG